jgi:hypothetical protein
MHYIEQPLNEADSAEDVQINPLEETPIRAETKKNQISGKARIRQQHQEIHTCMQDALLRLTQVVSEQQETLLIEDETIGEALSYIVRLSLASEAMQLATNLLVCDDPAIAQHTSDALQQLRRRLGKWERNSSGWFELRHVNGCGPYLYHRYRGEDGKKYTEYYGKLERQPDGNKTEE